MKTEKTGKVEIFYICLGILFIITGITVSFLGTNFLKVSFVRPDLVSWSMNLLGVLFIVAGIGSLFIQHLKTEQDKINENDERNIIIYAKAKASSYELLIVLLGFTLIGLTMLGYMNKISFLIFILIFITVQIYFIYRLWLLKKEM